MLLKVRQKFAHLVTVSVCQDSCVSVTIVEWKYNKKINIPSLIEITNKVHNAIAKNNEVVRNHPGDHEIIFFFL